MTGLTLCQQIDQIDFSEAATDLFVALSSFEASEESAAVILVAAAQLLARQHCDDTPRENDNLFSLCEEFADLVFETRKRLCVGRCRPALHIVGGRDVE